MLNDFLIIDKRILPEYFQKVVEARALLEEWGEAGAASTEKALEGIRSAMTEEELEIYDPLEAYRQLVDWLE